MLDQNTTTIITTAITALSTLGGAFGGIFFSNRHSTKLEQLRIEQDKLKRNTQIIEEAYTQLMFFDELNNQVASDVIWNDVTSFDFIERSKDIYLTFNRLYTLIGLHHTSLKNDLAALSDIFAEYWKYVGTLYDARKHKRESDTTDALVKRITEVRITKYIPLHKKLQKSLEDLAK